MSEFLQQITISQDGGDRASTPELEVEQAVHPQFILPIITD